MNKIRLIQILLIIGGVYYLIGAVAHFFGLTLFPFYVGSLYSPYHDVVISLAAITFSLLLFVVARNPKKNIDALNVILVGAIIAVVFSIGIILKIDFMQLGAPAKKIQTIVEMILLIIFAILVFILKPKKAKK